MVIMMGVRSTCDPAATVKTELGVKNKKKEGGGASNCWLFVCECDIVKHLLNQK